VDAFLSVASKRDVKRYSDRPLPADVATRILQAGRVTGSAVNRQPWRFFVFEGSEALAPLAETVFVPSNLFDAGLVVVIAARGGGRAAFDAGRAAQNMMIAAWNEGVGSSPNGFRDRDAAQEALPLDADEEPVIALSFGYPARGVDPASRTAEEWLERANRKPLDEVVVRL
jgi:nitroreductase